MADVQPIVLPLERSLYLANCITMILYGDNFAQFLSLSARAHAHARASVLHSGLQLWMFCQSIRYLCKQLPEHRYRQMFYITYSTLLMVLISIDLADNISIGQLIWIEHRDYPGGPMGYFAATTTAPFNVLGSAADITVNILGDGLLVN